jgi:DNA-binding HxlR family transcriptional regulator
MSRAKFTDSLGMTRRSDCPINYITELLGDRWTLLIIRDIMLNDKHTFGDFLSSPEGIARNILTEKLKRLEQNGLVSKQPHPTDGRKDIYVLTPKGQALDQILFAMSKWTFENEPMTMSHRPEQAHQL